MSKSQNATNYAITIDGELSNMSEVRWNKFVEKAIKEGKPAPVPEKVCTFITYEAETPGDFEQLAPSPDVQVVLFNRGSSLKQLNEIRDLMEDAKWEATDTPYDLLDVINRATERRAASPEEKAMKLLDGLDADALQRVMNALLNKQTTP